MPVPSPVTSGALVATLLAATTLGLAAPAAAHAVPVEPRPQPVPSASTAAAPADDPVDPRTADAEARISDRLPARLGDPRLGNRFGIAVVDAESGRTIVARGGSRRLLPASNMKILTATSVLTVLGPKHRFTTRVVRAPGASDLVLVGGGDPLLSSDDLRSLARQAADAYRADPSAAPRVTVHVDDSLFPKPTRGPGWTSSYMPYSAAPVRPLARLGDYSWDTTANAARVFTAALRADGLRAAYKGRSAAPVGAEDLAKVRNHTVADAVRTMLLVSENNVAETLFRHVGLAESGSATWKASSAGVSAVLTRLGVDTSRLRISDGSGLSRTDRLTPLAVASVAALSTRADQPRLAPIYRERGLPTAGKTGTLASGYGRYTTRPSRCARGKVFAKTGSLFDTIALSGIAMGADGRPKAFSFLVNDRPQSVAMLSTRQALDGLAATVTGCW